jgi:hypothetical protein
MINHIWTIICEKSIIDQETNNISLYNVLEQITITRPADIAEERPGIIPIKHEVVTLWMREQIDQPIRAMARMKLESQSGQVWPANEFEVDLSEHVRMRTILRSDQLLFDTPGIYHFQIEIQKPDEHWENVGKIPLQIVIQ